MTIGRISALAIDGGAWKRVRLTRLMLREFRGDLTDAMHVIHAAFVEALSTGRILEYRRIDDGSGDMVIVWREAVPAPAATPDARHSESDGGVEGQE